MEVSFDIQAFSKLILHLTKYPQNSVNGLLLKRIGKGDGEKQQSDGSAGSGDGDNQQKITFHETIPLLHICKYVTPMMELALAQIEQFVKTRKYEIAGYYQANQLVNDNNPDFVALKIAEKLSEYYPNFIVVMVDNEKLDSNLECAPFSIYKYSDGKLRPKESNIILKPDQKGALSTVSALIQAKSYKSLIDFDNYLDDISQDYLNNPDFNERIREFIS